MVICIGSVVNFHPPNPSKSAIVNAANKQNLGGSGVDGAITKAGGLNLHSDWLALLASADGVRCKTGSAIITGPNTYGG